MKKCIIAPDSFKGTMHAADVCGIIESVLRKHFPDCDIISIPAADGGEGTVDCFLAAFKDGVRIPVRTKGALLEDIDCNYGFFGDFSVIEMASVVGLPMMGGLKDPAKTSTYGLGALITDAIAKGSKRIYIGMGGTGTNDCGAGVAVALGTKFFNADGKPFTPTGGTLSKVISIDTEATRNLLEGIDIIGMYDSACPMHGVDGAAYIYAPQKGANPEQTEFLDMQLKAMAKTIQTSLGTDVSLADGAGAGGAMGAGIMAFLGGRLEKGIDTIINICGLEEALIDCDCIFTGEGRLDRQSLSGKVVSGIVKLAKKHEVPAIIVAGDVDGDMGCFYEIGASHIFKTAKDGMSADEIKLNCREDLKEVVDRISETVLAQRAPAPVHWKGGGI
jgi:glycerate kinase